MAETINEPKRHYPCLHGALRLLAYWSGYWIHKRRPPISMDEVQAVFARLLNFMSAHGPVIIVLEGIDRADRESLDLVERLVDGGQAGSVLFLGLATATEEVDPQQALPWLQRGDDTLWANRAAGRSNTVSHRQPAYGGRILGLMTPLPMRLMDLVVAESGGNPLYI